MPLIGEPDFEAWLEWRAGRDLPKKRKSASHLACQGCGAKPDASLELLHGWCMVCLAHDFGWDQAVAAGMITGTMRVALSRVPYLPARLLHAVADVAFEYEEAPEKET